MREQTKYNYEKRIKNLERENEVLRDYKRVLTNIYDGVKDCVKGGTNISLAWILYQVRDLLK